MKRIFLIIPLIMLILTSCMAQPAKIQKEFKSEVTANYNKIKIKAEIESANHSLRIKIKSPKNLNGYTYNYNSSDLSIQYGDLILNSEYNYIPESAFSNILYNVLETANRDKINYNGKYNTKAQFDGKCESGKFTIETDYNTGYISNIALNSLDFLADFKYK